MNNKSAKDKAKLLLNTLNGKAEIESVKKELKMYREMAIMYSKAVTIDNVPIKNSAIIGFMNMYGEMENLCENLLSIVDESLEVLTQCGAIFADLSNFCVDPDEEYDPEKE